MKRVYGQCFFFMVLIFPLSNALQLSEVMPDCGNRSANCEFVEIFSQDTADLLGYVLDVGGQKLALNRSFQGYLVVTKNKNVFFERFGIEAIEWKGMGLANDGDDIKLIKNNATIDSFTYSSSKKNMSWQKLGEWRECLPTPGMPNHCQDTRPAQGKSLFETDERTHENETNGGRDRQQVERLENSSNHQENSRGENADEQQVNSPYRNEISNADNITGDDGQKGEESSGTHIGEIKQNTASVSDEIEAEVIYLGGKDIKTLYKSRNTYVKEYAIYGFALFCVLIIIVLIIRRS